MTKLMTFLFLMTLSVGVAQANPAAGGQQDGGPSEVANNPCEGEDGDRVPGEALAGSTTEGDASGGAAQEDGPTP
jgi:hypothetical protein